MDWESILQEKAIPYKIICTDKPIRSAQEGADCLGVALEATAPTLILKAQSQFFAVTISGARRLDFRKIAKILGYKHVSLANKDEARMATGYNTGEIPVVGHGLPCVIDGSLYNFEYIYGGAGDKNLTLKIDPHFIAVVNKVIAEYFD